MLLARGHGNCIESADQGQASVPLRTARRPRVDASELPAAPCGCRRRADSPKADVLRELWLPLEHRTRLGQTRAIELMGPDFCSGFQHIRSDGAEQLVRADSQGRGGFHVKQRFFSFQLYIVISSMVRKGGMRGKLK